MRQMISMSAVSGTDVESHKEACELFNNGHNIIIMVKIGNGDYTPTASWEH